MYNPEEVTTVLFIDRSSSSSTGFILKTPAQHYLELMFELLREKITKPSSELTNEENSVFSFLVPYSANCSPSQQMPTETLIINLIFVINQLIETKITKPKATKFVEKIFPLQRQYVLNNFLKTMYIIANRVKNNPISVEQIAKSAALLNLTTIKQAEKQVVAAALTTPSFSLKQESSSSTVETITLYEQANTLISQGKCKEAEEMLRKVIILEPRYTKAHRDLGALLWKTKKYEEAKKELEQARELDTNDAVTHNALALLLLDEHSDPAALKELQEAIRLDPTYAEAYYNLGCCLLDQKNYSSADTAFANAVKFKPQFPLAQETRSATNNGWGTALYEQRKYEEAKAKFSLALKIDPKNTTAQQNLKHVSKIIESQIQKLTATPSKPLTTKEELAALGILDPNKLKANGKNGRGKTARGKTKRKPGFTISTTTPQSSTAVAITSSPTLTSTSTQTSKLAIPTTKPEPSKPMPAQSSSTIHPTSTHSTTEIETSRNLPTTSSTTTTTQNSQSLNITEASIPECCRLIHRLSQKAQHSSIVNNCDEIISEIFVQKFNSEKPIIATVLDYAIMLPPLVLLSRIEGAFTLNCDNIMATFFIKLGLVGHLGNTDTAHDLAMITLCLGCLAEANLINPKRSTELSSRWEKNLQTLLDTFVESSARGPSLKANYYAMMFYGLGKLATNNLIDAQKLNMKEWQKSLDTLVANYKQAPFDADAQKAVRNGGNWLNDNNLCDISGEGIVFEQKKLTARHSSSLFARKHSIPWEQVENLGCAPKTSVPSQQIK